MILVYDNFLPEQEFYDLQKLVLGTSFKTIKAGDKDFLCTETPQSLRERLFIENHRIVFSFIRKAHKAQDTDWRIHCDSIINGERPVLASVFYINPEEGVTQNGTAFWKYSDGSERAPLGIDNKSFDRLLTKDSNNIKKWQKTSYIASCPNRLLVYDSSMYHSKFPKVIQEGERIVCASFYTKD
jgi:hypothetical protein